MSEFYEHDETELGVLKAKIRPYLTRYLDKRDIQVDEQGRTWIKCISPYHEDDDPSMHLHPDSDGEILKCFGCLPLYQEVVTSRGILPASEVQVGDFVFDTYGKRTSVNRIHQHRSEAPTLKMVTSIDSEGFFATADHDMLWISPPVSKRKHVRKDYHKSDKIYEAELRHLQPGMWVPLSIPEGTSDKCTYFVRNTLNTPKIKREKVRIKLDEAFAYFLGLYAAEGSTSGNRIVQFSIHQNEVNQFLPVIQEIASRIGSTASVNLRKDSLGASIYICDTRLANLVDEIVGIGCENKKCPKDILFHLNPAIPKAWARGVFEGDGYAERGLFTVTSKALARAFFTATLRSGCLPRWVGRRQWEGKKDTYQVHLLENSQNQLYEDLITERVHHHVALIWVDAWDGWTLCARIENISSTGKYETVVDITTRLKTFSCPTVSVHNCGEAVDIFTAHAYLEGAPLEDAEFVYENVYVLADMFDVKHDEVNFTQDQLELMKARRLMRDAAIVFTEMAESQWVVYRDWDPEETKKLGVGTIRDTAAFYAAIESRGRHSHQFMVEQGLQHNKKYNPIRLFGSDRLTFMIRDHKGHPTGFACRNYSESRPEPKYLNTPQKSDTREYGSTLYKKDQILYGLDMCKMAKNKRLDVFEGYADWITARLSGHMNCVAMCGTAFTTAHVELLLSLGFKHINFVMDDDKTGHEKMIGDPSDPRKQGYLFKGKGIPNLKITVGFLPFDGEEKDERDPDAWLLKHTIEEYEQQLEIFDAFRWQLKVFQEEGTWGPEDILENLIGYLHNEENLVLRREKVQQLAAATGFDVDSIQDEYERRFNKETNRLINKTMGRLEKTYNTSDKVDLVKGLVEDLEAQGHKDNADSTQNEVIRDFLSFSDWTERKDLGLAGWDCGFDFMNTAMNGIPKDGQWIGFAGNANCGKCFGKGTKILMYDGSTKKVENIINGDKVMGEDSTPRIVQGMTKGIGKMFRVTLRNGDSYVCNDRHILVLKRVNRKQTKFGSKRNGEILELSVDDYQKKTNHFKKFYRHFKVRVDYPDLDLPIDPYYVGLWLGDGSVSKPEVTTADQEIVEYLRDYASSLGLSTTEYECKSSPGTFRVSITGKKTGKVIDKPEPLLVKLRDLGILNNKHIPNRYLINSRANRFHLLAGLIDSDGYSGVQSSIGFCNKNEMICDQVVTLVRSLGLCATKGSKYNKKYDQTYYTVYIGGNNLEEIPLLLKRKYPQKLVTYHKDTSTYSCSVEEIGEGEYFGFQVNNNGRFLLSDFTVTHNSALVLAMGLGLVRKNPSGLTVLYWSLDDPRHVSYMKWLAAMTSEEINECGQARRTIWKDPDRKKRFIEAKEELLTHLDDKRLSVKGEEYGNVTPLLTRWIDGIQQETGNHCVVIVDSFNNVEYHGKDELAAQRSLSKWMRSSTQKYGFTVISTLECNKMGIVEKRPRLGHLYGSAKLGFDLKFIGMVYNDLHENREEAGTVWIDSNGQPKPYIEVSVEKNKLSAFKGELAYKFHPSRAMVNEVDPKSVSRLRDGTVSESSWEDKKSLGWEDEEIVLGGDDDSNGDDLWT